MAKGDDLAVFHVGRAFCRIVFPREVIRKSTNVKPGLFQLFKRRNRIKVVI